MISIISLKRLIEGGAAILALSIKNHSIDRVGVTVNNPLVSMILRVCLISYDRLARQNIPEDTTPWATIIIREPIIPSFVWDITPATRSPMWPTDE